MTREQLERLVWSKTHRDYRSADDTERSILRPALQLGPRVALLSSFTLGELVDCLGRDVAAAHGLVLWRLVLCADSRRVLGVFGAALVNEWLECERKVARETGMTAARAYAVGPRPVVGSIFDESQSTIAAGRVRAA